MCAGAKTLDRERQRMSFFQSLRKGASNGGASSPQPPDAAVSPPEAAASPLPSRAEAAAAEQLKAAEASVPAANGHLSSIQEHCELPNGVAQQEIPERLQQQVRLCHGQATLLQQLGACVMLEPVCSSTGPPQPLLTALLHAPVRSAACKLSVLHWRQDDMHCAFPGTLLDSSLTVILAGRVGAPGAAPHAHQCL